MKENNIFKDKKNYRCRPSLYQSVATSKYLVDLDGTSLFFFDWEKFALKNTLEVLAKSDQFCAKLRVLNENFIVVFGMNKFTVIDPLTFKITAEVAIEYMIENVESKKDYVVVMTSDE